jgi:hypothetical protein
MSGAHRPIAGPIHAHGAEVEFRSPKARFVLLVVALDREMIIAWYGPTIQRYLTAPEP